MLFLLILFACLPVLASPPPLLATHLSQASWQRVQQILRSRPSIALEQEYQTLVNREVLEALYTFYAPENAARLKMTYASFTPEGSEGGEDSGFGLHVIKRLTLPLPNGRSRTIDVNEHWAEDRLTGGLFLPDEIRVKVQVADGERHVAGSHALYLFDLLRVAWSESGEIDIKRRTHMDSMRVAVASPFACQSCHDDGSYFAADFLRPGERRNFEAIVQDSHFRIPIGKTRGFREYLAHIDSRPKMTAEFRSQLIQSLLAPSRSMNVPRIHAYLAGNRGAISWLGPDLSINGFGHSYPRTGQGAYLSAGAWMVDAIDAIFEGKYRYWSPAVVVP